MATRKTRTGTVQADVAMMQAVSVVVQSPIPLNQDETVVFLEIVEARAATSWSKYELRLAAKLARLTVYDDEQMRIVMEEGPTQYNDKGTRIANPLHAARTQMTQQIQSLVRTLGISASQSGKAGKDAKAANEASDRARDVLSKASHSQFL
jgi:hypothetical protein